MIIDKIVQGDRRKIKKMIVPEGHVSRTLPRVSPRNPENMRELEQFLADNVKDCSFEEVGFRKAAMHTYVLEHITELIYCLNLCDY